MTAADPITGASREQLAELATRFPEQFVERIEGNAYVAHHVINQRLLSVVGPFDFKLVEVLRGDLPALEPDPNGRSRRAKAGSPALSGVVVGGVWRLVAEIDGRRVEVEEVGDVDPRNKDHDGARLKDAASDALKRCAMRLGLGLHLWAQEHYFLDTQLAAAPPPPHEPAAPQTSKPGGANESENASPDPRPTADETAKGPAASSGPDAAGTPPGFDHIRTAASGAVIRSWIKGYPDADFREAVFAKAAETGVKIAEAAPDDLRTLIEVAWKTRQAA